MSIEKPSRNEGEYFAHENAELLRKQREKLEAAAAEAERKTHYMKCPKDGYDLASSEYHGVQIETCPHCGGMWLDAGELEIVAHEQRPALMTRVLSEALVAFQGAEKKHGTGQ
jgi:Zn-finger nucleic acid-binding protein